MDRKMMLDLLEENGMMAPEGMADCIVGICASTGRAVVSVGSCINHYVSEGMTQEEALEYFDFNTLRGADYIIEEKRPIFVNFCDEEAPQV